AVLQKIHDIARHLGETPASAETISCRDESSSSPSKPYSYFLGIPARSQGAQIALDVLCQFLDTVTCRVKRLSTATLASEVIAVVAEELPDLICLTALPPGGAAHARYLCKRLRAQFPPVRILVVCPGLQEDPTVDFQAVVQRLTEAGADKVAMSVTEAKTA